MVPSARRPPPELFDRFAAKAIDGAIWVLLVVLVPPAGTLFGILFWLLADGLFNGASPGKHVVGLLVLRNDRKRVSNLKESAIRNVPFAIPAVLMLLPGGPIFASVIGIPILLLETYFLITDPQQVRIGDVFADTLVVNGKPRRKKYGRADGPPPDRAVNQG